MAASQLGIYNDALLLIGERPLQSLSEEREPRRLLDSSYDLGAVSYCLEIVKPVFARTTVKLTSSTTSATHDLDNVFTLPDDWITTVEVYNDSRLDQPIKRYINEARTIACEFDTIYVRYVSSTNETDFTLWPLDFTKVVSAFLAREIAIRLAPDEYETLNDNFTDRAEIAISVESDKEPLDRPKASTTTLSLSWINIYNDALLIMGLQKITNADDDSHRRATIDTAIDADLVKFMLEDIGWNWAISSAKIEENPSLEPTWGWRFAFDKPTDLHRLDGVFVDEYFQRPLKTYLDEGDFFFSDVDLIFIKYVSSDFINNPSGWASSFRKLIAGRIAKETYMTLAPDKEKRVEKEYQDRYSDAKTIDAMQSPPRVITEGSWVRSRNSGRHHRRRP